MSGFFDESELDDVVRGDEHLVQKRRKGKVATCTECGLANGCLSPRMSLSGEGRKEILIIAEAPGKVEDKKGIQLVGKAGNLVRGILDDMNLDLDRDFWKTNAVCCRPPDNKTPTSLQVAACRWRVMEAIEKYKPKVIIPMGKTAVDSLLGHRVSGRLNGLSMTDWLGHQIPDQELKTFICPTWHPSFILRSGQNGQVDGVVKSQFIDHIKQAVDKATKPFYLYDFSSECFITEDVGEVIKNIHHVMKSDLVTVDYETTGLKPYREGHRIVVASVSDGMNSFAFPFFNDNAFRQAWYELMWSQSVRKVAHNAKFEALWTRVCGGLDGEEGYWPRRLDGCSMLASHACDNRERVNLKFQTYVRFGIMGYDDEISPYLKAINKEKQRYGANGFNMVESAPLDKLMLYCAMDSLATYKLWDHVISRIPSRHMIQGIDLFSEASISFAKAECAGIAYDEETAIEQGKGIQAKMDRLETQVLAMPELERWDKPKPFRMSAPQDICHVLFNIMGKACDDEDRTPTNKPKADEATLAKYDIPIVKKVLAWRKWAKVNSTYLGGFTRESWGGFLHPSFNLFGVDTFRSSSDGPNFQNIPKRDEQVAALLRALIRPRPGRMLAAYDYGQMEFVIYTCYTKDKTMIEYVNDPDSDIHRDQAALIFLKDKSDIDKKERFNGKNGFTFPTIYGSWFKNTAKNIWNTSEEHTIKHLKSEGIKNLNDFTAHMESVEEDFWARFHVAYEWMEKAIKDYNKKGYVDLLTGFRCYGPMSRNQLINYRVQGSAFHCLLWTFHRMMGWLEKKEKQTLLPAQIHDEMLYDMVPEEEAELDHAVWDYGTQKIREYWDWIIVPLTIEKSLSAVDGSWSEMTDCGILEG